MGRVSHIKKSDKQSILDRDLKLYSLSSRNQSPNIIICHETTLSHPSSSFHTEKKELHHGHKASYLLYFVFLATCKELGFHSVDFENIYLKAEICWSRSCKPDYSKLEGFQA